MAKVALVKGNSRYQNIFQALTLIKDQLSLEKKKKIVIKPNLVHADIPLCAIQPEVVKAILDFLYETGIGSPDEKIIIAEGSFQIPTSDGFKSYNYYEELKDYNLEFIDLNTDDFIEVEIFDRDLKPIMVRVAKTIIESDFRISPALLKTHDTVVATLSLKNMVVGSLLKDKTRDDKDRIHQGYKAINMSLAKLAEIIPPHLSVIDGLIGMEGDGPARGETVKMDLALAGTDFLAVDTVGAALMELDINQIGYLTYCQEKGLGEGDLNKIEIVGQATIEQCRKKFKPHSEFEDQLKWK
ncbi:MAG TPA: DUF362 domain-containing protein [Candidatus Portnoybacteria bacterium]|nr:DUF362 domain-containing protein [Candidatus Portnoybacteria bacterium]